MKLMVFLASVLFALGAAPAYADPVTALATTVFAWAGGTAVALAQLTIGFGASLLLGVIQKATTKSQSYEASVSFDITFGDDAALTFVLGEYATAGKLKYIGSWGRNTRFLTEVYEYSCLPQGMSGLWVNDEKGSIASGYGCVPEAQLSSIGAMLFSVKTISSYDSVPAGYVFVGHPVTTSDMDGRPAVFVKWIDGTQTEADPFLVAAFKNRDTYPWTAEMIGTGKSYAVVTTVYDEDIMTSRPSFLFEVDPLPVYDPRKDSTTGGSGTHVWGDRSTYEPSTNPAVNAYNVARGIYLGDEWVLGSKNLPAWRLPRAEWIAAMNECDAAVDLDAGGTEAAYRCGAEVSVDAAANDVLSELGKAGNMRFAEVGGRMKPLVGLPGASVFSITDGDIIITEGQSLSLFYPISDTYNSINATYPEPAEKWASKDAPEYTDADATAADGDRYLPVSITYGAVPYANQVQRLMRSQLSDYRRMGKASFMLPPDAYALEPLDMITWDSDRNGYEGKQFLIESVTKMAGMNVSVTMREVDPSDYDWSTDFELPYTTTTPVNIITAAQTISDFTAVATTITDTDGASRIAAILVGCDPDEVGIDRVRIQVRKVGETATVVDQIAEYDDPWQWTITGVAQGTAYEVRGALISSLTNSYSWSDWITVTTPTIVVTLADLSAALQSDLNQLNVWIEGDVINDLQNITEYVSVAGDVGSASGQFRVSVLATETGTESKIGLKAVASGAEADSTRSAALYLLARSDGTSLMLVDAGMFAVTGGDTDVYPFVVSGGQTYINTAVIGDATITEAKIADAAITTAKIAEASIDTLRVQDNAITTLAATTSAGNTGSQSSGTAWLDIWSLSFAGHAGEKAIVLVSYKLQNTTTASSTDLASASQITVNDAESPFGTATVHPQSNTGGTIGNNWGQTSAEVNFSQGVDLIEGTNTVKLKWHRTQTSGTTTASFPNISISVLRAIK